MYTQSRLNKSQVHKIDFPMSTFTQIVYQIVFGTRMRLPSLQKQGREELFAYITGILKNKSCHSYRVGGVDDHLHIVCSLNPNVTLASLIKDIKLGTTDMIKRTKLFPHFGGWQEGYGAFTYSLEAKDNLIDYVENQETHHRKESFRDEFIRLLKEHKIEFDEKYLM
jgi:putative transposase